MILPLTIDFPMYIHVYIYIYGSFLNWGYSILDGSYGKSLWGFPYFRTPPSIDQIPFYPITIPSLPTDIKTTFEKNSPAVAPLEALLGPPRRSRRKGSIIPISHVDFGYPLEKKVYPNIPRGAYIVKV